MDDKRTLGGERWRSVSKANAENDLMRLSYGQVTRLLTLVLQVDGAKAIALSGRLKHFQRAGFPGGTNTGPGPRAIYRIDQVFDLVFAFRLLAMRFPPRDAAAAVEANRNVLRNMLLAAWARRNSAGVGVGTDQDDGPLLAGILPDGLEDLRRGDFNEGPADVISQVSQRQVWSWMRGVDSLPAPGLVLVDVDALVEQTLAAADQLGLASATDIVNGFRELAEQTGDKGASAERSGI